MSDGKSVLHLISGGDVGGAKTHVLSLLQGLAAHRAVCLVCFREGAFAQEARQLGISVEIVATGRFFRDLRQVARLAREYNAALIHCHGAKGNLFGTLLKRRLGLPVITTLHSDYRRDYMGRPLAALTFGVINRLALRRMDYWVSVSDVLCDMLIDRGFPPDRQYAVRNGLDFALPPGLPAKEEARARLGLPADPSLVVAGIAARLQPVKSVGTLLAALAEVASACPRLHVVIAGDGPQREELMALCRQMKLEKRVTFAGWQSDMPAFFAALDINVLTSLSEGFPYVLIEGARFGCATAATRVGGIPRLIDHEVNGLLFTPGDTTALASYLKRLAVDAGLRRRMGEQLRQKAAQTFSLSATVETQLTIYDDICAREAAGRLPGIVICGAYGKGNAGDDAILEAVLRELHEVFPRNPVTVLSRNPRNTRREYRVPTLYSFHIPAFIRRLRKSFLFLHGGGNLIQDVTSSRSLWYYLFTLWCARKMGVRTVMLGCGVGPVRRPANRKMAGALIDRCVDAISLREDSSLSELTRLRVTRPEILLTADPALTLSSAPDAEIDSLLLTQGLRPEGRYIAFALRPWPGFQAKAAAFAEAADYAYQAYGLTPVFISIEGETDEEASRAAAAQCQCPYVMLPRTGPASTTIGLLARMEIVVAMRLHALIFGCGQGVALVGAAYDDKVSAFMRYMGQDRCTPLSEITADILKSHIDAAALSRDDKERRMEALSHLLALEKGNQKLLQRMLKA